MTHENNPATHLVKQGDKLYWKVPHKNPNITEGYYYGTEAIHILDPENWPDKEEFSREEVEIYHTYKDMPEFDGKDVRLAARYKGEPKLSDKIGHINCDPEALKDPVFVKAVNNMAEMAYKMPAKEEPSPVEPGCSHKPLIDTGIGYYHCPACNKGWTYSEYKSLQKDVSMNVMEPSPVEQFRAEVVKALEDERDNVKKYISPGESSYTFFSFSVRSYDKAIEIVKETQIK